MDSDEKLKQAGFLLDLDSNMLLFPNVNLQEIRMLQKAYSID